MPKRSKPVKPKSDRRRKRDAARPAIPSIDEAGERVPIPRDDHSFREFARRTPCSVCMRLGRGVPMSGDPCHVRNERDNGDWIISPDTGELESNIYPACRIHHSKQHSGGFSAVFGDEARDEAAREARALGQAYLLGWGADELAEHLRARRVSVGRLDLENSIVLRDALPH